MDLYSAFAEERAIVVCFLDFQDIKESPKKTQKPKTDLRVFGQPVQSESKKAFKSLVEEVGKNGP
jgi:hypothetical protein